MVNGPLMHLPSPTQVLIGGYLRGAPEGKSGGRSRADGERQAHVFRESARVQADVFGEDR